MYLNKIFTPNDKNIYINCLETIFCASTIKLRTQTNGDQNEIPTTNPKISWRGSARGNR
jgi:hypothetical protein